MPKRHTQEKRLSQSIHVSGKRAICKADVAAGLPDTVRICCQKWFLHGHKQKFPQPSHPQHRALIRSCSHTSCNIFSNTRIKAFWKGPIRNILLTFLPQEPSFLRQSTLINGMCVQRGGVPGIHAQNHVFAIMGYKVEFSPQQVWHRKWDPLMYGKDCPVLSCTVLWHGTLESKEVWTTKLKVKK